MSKAKLILLIFQQNLCFFCICKSDFFPIFSLTFPITVVRIAKTTSIFWLIANNSDPTGLRVSGEESEKTQKFYYSAEFLNQILYTYLQSCRNAPLNGIGDTNIEFFFFFLFRRCSLGKKNLLENIREK